MSPEEILEAQRQAIHDWEEAPAGSRRESEAAERATGAAAALDYWMLHQGTLPVAWLEGRKAFISQVFKDVEMLMPRVEHQVTLNPYEKAAIKRLREAAEYARELGT